MKKLLLAALFFATISAQAMGEKSSTCDDGDYHLSLQVSADLQNLKLGICEYGDCSGDLPLTAQINRVDSEGNRKTYKLQDSQSSMLALYFDAKPEVISVEKIVDGYVVQTFTNCVSN